MIAHPPVNGCTIAGAHDCRRSSIGSRPIVPPLRSLSTPPTSAPDPSAHPGPDASRVDPLCDGSGQLVAELVLAGALGWICPVCREAVPLDGSCLADHRPPAPVPSRRDPRDEWPTLGL